MRNVLCREELLVKTKPLLRLPNVLDEVLAFRRKFPERDFIVLEPHLCVSLELLEPQHLQDKHRFKQRLSYS